jgi:hypothetical protein
VKTFPELNIRAEKTLEVLERRRRRKKTLSTASHLDHHNYTHVFFRRESEREEREREREGVMVGEYMLPSGFVNTGKGAKILILQKMWKGRQGRGKGRACVRVCVCVCVCAVTGMFEREREQEGQKLAP